jgi:hypothetical protein
MATVDDSDRNWQAMTCLAWRCLGAAALLAGSSGAALAAEWLVEPIVAVGSVYDDNISLIPGNPESTSGYVVAAQLEVERRTELSTTKMRAAAGVTDYRRENIEDKNEQRAFLDWQRRTSERGTLGLGAEYRRDALFATVIVADDTGDPRDTDVALTSDTRVRRNYRVLRPSWNWLLTERSALRIGYRWTDADFSDADATSLVDYTDNVLSATYTREISPRDNFNVTGNLGHYQPDASDAKSSTQQLLAGITRKFTEQLSGSFAGGLSRTRQHDAGNSDTSSGFVFNASVRQRSDFGSLEGFISRDVTPSGIGRTVRADQVRVLWNRRASETVEYVVKAQLLQQHALEGAGGTTDRRYRELSPELHWQWLENLEVVGSLRWRRQKFDAQSETANSRAVFLGVSYAL